MPARSARRTGFPQRAALRLIACLGAAFLPLLCPAGCTPRATCRTVLPEGQGDLAIVALVAWDAEGLYPVLDHTQLFPVAAGALPLGADVDREATLRLVVFLYDAAELAPLLAPGRNAAWFAAHSTVTAAAEGEEGLPSEGRTDFVSAGFGAAEGSDLPTGPAAADAVLVAMCDRVAGQLALLVTPPDGGSDAAADAGGDGGPDSGADAAADAGTDSGVDAGCLLGPFEAPTPLPVVNSTSGERSPAISSDGLTLFFCSERSGGSGSLDLWASDRPSTSSDFGAAWNLGAVNSVSDDSAPAISWDGLTLYFDSTRAGGQGMEDLYVAVRPDTLSAFGAATPIDEINSADREENPSISSDDLTLYFGSDRAGGLGDDDIHFATRPDLLSPFGAVTNILEVNSASYDSAPSISADDLTLYFSSERPVALDDELRVAIRPDTASAFGAPVDLSTLNTSDSDSAPAISSDGLTLYWRTDRPGGPGFYDIWFAERGCL